MWTGARFITITQIGREVLRAEIDRISQLYQIARQASVGLGQRAMAVNHYFKPNSGRQHI
jgi:hypothetical protein